ncbi:unnamed protein product, partial [Oikopleura dioica]
EAYCQANFENCMSCWYCTYSADSAGLVGGANCFSDFGGVDQARMKKQYCRNGTDSSVYDGDSSSGQFECDGSDEAFQSFCSVSNRMRRSSNYWLFTLSRSASAVKISDQNKLPIPSPVGLAVRSTWAATSICRGNDCNDKFINQKNSDFPEFGDEGSGGGDSSIPTRNTCLSCDGCWNATQAEPEECPENQPFCYTSVSGEWDSTTSIRRRCSDDVLGTQRSDTLTIQEERNICVSGNIPCNGFNMPFNFIEDLPIPSRQDFSRPLGEKEIEFMCGGLEDNCISCYTCTDASDPFNSCTTLPEFNQSKPPTFLRVVYDSDAEEFLENVCSLTVLRSVTGDGLPETMVRRNVVQVKRGQAVPAFLNDQQTSVSGCSGNFCNGNQQGLPNDDTQCFRCQGNSTADPNNPCVTGNLTPFVDPSVKCANSLCKTTIYGDIVRRDCATTEDLFGLDASSGHVTVSSDSATSFVCKTNKCNDIYVDSDNVIRTDADFHHLNSVFVFAFLPRRHKFDKISSSFKSQTKCDEMRQPRS